MRNRLIVKRYSYTPIVGARNAKQTIWERIRQMIKGRRYIVVSQSRVTSIDHAYGRLREWDVKDVILACWFDGKERPTNLVKDGKYINQYLRVSSIDKSVKVTV